MPDVPVPAPSKMNPTILLPGVFLIGVGLGVGLGAKLAKPATVPCSDCAERKQRELFDAMMAARARHAAGTGPGPAPTPAPVAVPSTENPGMEDFVVPRTPEPINGTP